MQKLLSAALPRCIQAPLPLNQPFNTAVSAPPLISAGAAQPLVGGRGEGGDLSKCVKLLPSGAKCKIINQSINKQINGQTMEGRDELFLRGQNCSKRISPHTQYDWFYSRTRTRTLPLQHLQSNSHGCMLLMLFAFFFFCYYGLV